MATGMLLPARVSDGTNLAPVPVVGSSTQKPPSLHHCTKNGVGRNEAHPANCAICGEWGPGGTDAATALAEHIVHVVLSRRGIVNAVLAGGPSSTLAGEGQAEG